MDSRRELQILFKGHVPCRNILTGVEHDLMNQVIFTRRNIIQCVYYFFNARIPNSNNLILIWQIASAFDCNNSDSYCV